jgi:hypothetical protein
MTPAMNRAPTEVLVATEYITMTMDGGIRMPARGGRDHAGAEALREALPTIAGRRMEPMATTVAGEEPETAANSAQATAGQARPPYQWPTMELRS